MNTLLEEKFIAANNMVESVNKIYTLIVNQKDLTEEEFKHSTEMMTLLQSARVKMCNPELTNAEKEETIEAAIELSVNFVKKYLYAQK